MFDLVPGDVVRPIGFFAALAGMVIAYLGLIEIAKRVLFANPAGRLPTLRRRGHTRHIQRRASRFSYPGPRTGPTQTQRSTRSQP